LLPGGFLSSAFPGLVCGGHAKALAKRLGWPVVVGAQLNRQVENRGDQRPTLSDLRESGAIEQDADQVIGLYRPGYYTDKRKPGSAIDPNFADWQVEHYKNLNVLDLLVLKNRHGPEDTIRAYCDMRASAIRDREPS
jgi:replicative DNA helicase